MVPKLVLMITTLHVTLQLSVCRGNDDVFERQLEQAKTSALEYEKHQRDLDQQKRKSGEDHVAWTTAGDFLEMFAAPAEEIGSIAEQASIQLQALRRLAEAYNISEHELRTNGNYRNLWRKHFAAHCTNQYQGKACSHRALYRTATGACNNLCHPEWGSTFISQARELPAMYDDGFDEPRQTDRLGLPLPNVRTISNILFSVEGETPRTDRLTVMVMQWGQFIDHEFVATPILTGENGANIQCCGQENENREQCFPIHIPDGDPHFTETCMNFVRSAPALDPSCGPGVREQINQVTSFIDGSAIYGSTQAATLDLRTLLNGLMESRYNQGNMLPGDVDEKCDTDEPGSCQKAGDARVNVAPSLGVSHTLFFRAHNIMARELARINRHWNDETLFQETRKIIAAMLQHITYNEYLPSILNEEIRDLYDLNLQNGYSNCYDPTLNPTIANVFAVAAFRFGHSLIPGYMAMMSKSYDFEDIVPLTSNFHNPHLNVVNNGTAMNGIARWLVSDVCPKGDNLFEKSIRDELFLDKNNKSLDLTALNIQRGRDHGIPPYNYWRKLCGLGTEAVKHMAIQVSALFMMTISGYFGTCGTAQEQGVMSESGEFILPDHTQELSDKLSDLYTHVDDIDLFAGAMTETSLPDSSMGPTFACLIAKQFMRLKNGDRFWYESQRKEVRFTRAQLQEIKKVSLAGILCNCYDIDTIQRDVFYIASITNERVNCSEIPTIDLKKWKTTRRIRRP